MKKNERISDAIGNVDSKYVDEYMNRKGGKTHGGKGLKIVAIIAAAAIMLTALLVLLVPMMGKNSVPVYRGMTARRMGSDNTTAYANPGEGYMQASLLYGPGDGEGTSGHNTATAKTKSIGENAGLEVKADNTVSYYANESETFLIEIHISNPNNYEILSFTLNGKKYANYMFKEGSTMELLLIEVTAPDTPGYIDYTIDAIKYVDGEMIKYVDMSEGEKTIKIGVIYEGAKEYYSVDLFIDGQFSNKLQAKLENGYKLTLPERPEDIVTDPNSDRYFYGWFLDRDYSKPVTDDTVFKKDTAIYAKWVSYSSDILSYTVDNGKIVITGLKFPTKHLVIVPSYIKSKPVKEIESQVFKNNENIRGIVILAGLETIGDDLFYGCKSLATITLPDSVTSIGSNAFYGCAGLASITVPDSVTSIGDYAFYGCSGLASMTIPDSVTSIGDYAFCRCSGLTGITIPDSVTSIGGYAFCRCTGVESITVSTGNTRYRSAGNCLIDSTSKTLIAGFRNSVIPTDGSVTSIGASAFEGCTKLTSLVIPDSVTSIGDYAFQQCSGLSSITIGNSVTSIGINAFSKCTGLTSIVIPDSVTSIGYYAFGDCTGLTSITIPDSATSIGDTTFWGCTSLTSIVIPDSVTSIGEYAFEGCRGLTSITIPNCVTSISFRAFDSCTSLTSITFAGTRTQWQAITKGDFWDDNTGNYTVICTDGRISKS